MSTKSDAAKLEHERASGDTQERESWFATFTFLDCSGAIGSSQLRRVSATLAKVWRLTLRSVSDRSKARVLGV
jgi:hypothetical protein